MYNNNQSNDPQRYGNGQTGGDKDGYQYGSTSTKYEEDEVQKPFVWGKKLERDRQMGREEPVQDVDAYIKEQREELQQVRSMREKRMKEQEEMRKLRENMRRELEMEANSEFSQHEHAFHRIQAWRKSEIRLNEGRPSVIDRFLFPQFVKMKLTDLAKLKAFGLSLGESSQVMKARERFIEFLDSDLIDLVHYAQGQPLAQLDELSGEVEGMKQQAQNARERDYLHEVSYWDCLFVCILRWKDVETVREKNPHMNFAQAEMEVAAGARDSFVTGNYVSESVASNVHALQTNQSLSKQIDQERQVSGKVEEEERTLMLPKGVETYGLVNSYAPFDLSRPVKSFANQGFWRCVHNELVLFACRAQLRAFVFRQMKMRIYFFEKVRRDEEERALKEYQRSVNAAEVTRTFVAAQHPMGEVKYEAKMDGKADMSMDTVNAKVNVQREAILASFGDAAVEDVIEALRARAAEEEEDAQSRAVDMGAEEGDEDAAEEVESLDLGPVVYGWADKCRPRKPRFVNKVRTGFAWHKYNRAHYDKNNPPPRTVQGYKFNLFYPDLIDPRVAPRFSVSADPQGNPDFCVLRFMAGAPYEDVAFRIVNKKWGTERRKGYKCVFNQGVLSLWFNFQRIGYRR